MATAEQLKALVRSHGEGDEARFYAIAVQVAAEAARRGQHRFAQELRDLVDAAKDRAGKRPGAPVPVVRPKGELVTSTARRHRSGSGRRGTTRVSAPV